MLKIFEFYVLFLFTVGYHGNQNIFCLEKTTETVLSHNLIMLNITFMGFQSDMKKMYFNKFIVSVYKYLIFFVQWCLSDMILNICTCSFIVYTMSNSKTKDAEYQIFVNWYYELVEVHFLVLSTCSTIVISGFGTVGFGHVISLLQ
jgi:hypothetical protein